MYSSVKFLTLTCCHCKATRIFSFDSSSYSKYFQMSVSFITILNLSPHLVWLADMSMSTAQKVVLHCKMKQLLLFDKYFGIGL